MSSFAENLKTLSPVERIERLELYRAGTRFEAAIENQPGSSGSVTIYYHLAQKYGVIDGHAAREGLDLYAEHVAEAQREPGRHPNVDRLLRMVANGVPESYAVHPIFHPI